MLVYTENLINLVQSSFSIVDEVKPVYCEETYDENLKLHRPALLKKNDIRRAEPKTVTDPMFQTSYEISVRDNELPVIGGYLSVHSYFSNLSCFWFQKLFNFFVSKKKGCCQNYGLDDAELHFMKIRRILKIKIWPCLASIISSLLLYLIDLKSL